MAQQTPSQDEQVQALRNRALAGLFFTAQNPQAPEHGAAYQFWSGYLKALNDLSSGFGISAALRDEISSGVEFLSAEAQPLVLADGDDRYRVAPTSGLGEVADSRADATTHDRLLDADLAEHGVLTAPGARQVDSAAGVATPPLRVVLGKAVKPALALLRMRLGLLKLRAQIAVFSLQRPDPLSQQAQVLAEHRRRAALVHERLNLFQQRLKHFILLRGGDASGHRSHKEGGAA